MSGKPNKKGNKTKGNKGTQQIVQKQITISAPKNVQPVSLPVVNSGNKTNIEYGRTHESSKSWSVDELNDLPEDEEF